MNGRFRADDSPEYPQPDQLLASRSHLHFPLPTLIEDPASENTEFTESPIVSRTFGLLRQLNAIFSHELGTRDDFWQDVTFPVYHLAPMMHRLLAIPRASAYDPLFFRQRECFRLACILYITNFQVKFDPDPGIGMLFGSKLKLNLDNEELYCSWGRSNLVFIWILLVGACATCLLPDLQSHFVTLLRRALRESEAGLYERLFDVVNGAPWCKEAFRSEIDVLNSQLNMNT